MLQFITNNKAGISPAEQVKKAIAGGCRWVEIETNGISDNEIANTVAEIKPECEEKGVFLLLVSRIDLAKSLNVGGVLLKQGDAPTSKARTELGPAAVIGLEVSSLAEVIAVSNLDIDFVAIQPFAGGDNPLGTDGLREICNGMEEKNIELARVACGGIHSEDVLSILEAGANGIAVSSSIALSEDISSETRKFIKQMPVGN